MKTVAVLPARMGSSRFPGKPLAPILGRPMIEHVYHRVAMSKSLDGVYVATCDQEIFDAVEAFGGKAVMTSDRHERASDRIAEAAESIDADVFVMVQGDEPMTHPDMIDEATAPFATDPSIQCVNLLKQIENEADYRNPNTIKVVVGPDNNALYFSRSPIPASSKNDFSSIKAYKQVCIIPFTRDSLAKFAALSPTPLEIAESVDMMRFLEHCVPVHMAPTQFDTQAVDDTDDLKRVEALMRDDPLTTQY
tara:strand:- start:3554 stop:4303 length:750 start_codon:yes stop_codon:yes gene_type:complete